MRWILWRQYFRHWAPWFCVSDQVSSRASLSVRFISWVLPQLTIKISTACLTSSEGRCYCIVFVFLFVRYFHSICIVPSSSLVISRDQSWRWQTDPNHQEQLSLQSRAPTNVTINFSGGWCHFLPSQAPQPTCFKAVGEPDYPLPSQVPSQVPKPDDGATCYPVFSCSVPPLRPLDIPSYSIWLWLCWWWCWWFWWFVVLMVRMMMMMMDSFHPDHLTASPPWPRPTTSARCQHLRYDNNIII